jgi:hypothetical protein
MRTEHAKRRANVPYPAALALAGAISALAAIEAEAQTLAGSRVGSARGEPVAIGELTWTPGALRWLQTDTALGYLNRATMFAGTARIGHQFGGRYLLAAATAVAHRFGADEHTISRFGIEGEAVIFGRFFLRPEWGHQFGDWHDRPDYVGAAATIFVTDDISLEAAGAFTSGDDDLYRLRLEWRPEQFGRFSLHADAVHELSDDNYTAFYVGARFMLQGKPMTLLGERRSGRRRGALDPLLDFRSNKPGPHRLPAIPMP